MRPAPGTWIIDSLGSRASPKKSVTPVTPSLPMVATPALAPFRITDITEHTPLSGKHTCVMGSPGLEILCLNFSGVSVR